MGALLVMVIELGPYGGKFGTRSASIVGEVRGA
jgi:hypothetical protein